MELYYWRDLFKALHIIGFVSWFAGLFYGVRLFVYHAEANQMAEPERSILIRQYNIMEWRLFRIITNPAMFFTVICGIGMFITFPDYLRMGWLQVKLGLLALLIGYHFYCRRIIRQLEQGAQVMSSFQFRLFNELPTLFLVSIVLLAIFRDGLNFGYAFGGIFLFGVLLFIGARAYRRARMKNKG